MESAQSKEDFKIAANLYQKASVLAPWKAEIYYNLALAQEKAGEPQAGVQSLKFYLLAAPNAADKAKVKEKIGVLEFKAEKKETVEKKSKAKKARAHSIEGVWGDITITRDTNGQYMISQPPAGTVTHTFQGLVVNGTSFTVREIATNSLLVGQSTYSDFSLTMSPDGNKLIGTSKLQGENGKVFYEGPCNFKRTQ